MSEQNKDNLDREKWLKSGLDTSSEAESDRPFLQDDVGSWEQRAIRGRTMLGKEDEAQAFLNDLDTAIDQQYGEHPVHPIKKDKRIFTSWLAVAASALVLLVAAWWLLSGTASPEQLYTQHFTHFDNDLSVSTMGAIDSTSLAQSLKPYNARRYQEAASSIDQYLQENPDEQALRLYLGISLMESGAAENAIDQLESIDKTSLSEYYRQTIDWYLSLAYLKSGQAEKAKKVLQTISSPEHPYAQQAATLLKQL